MVVRWDSGCVLMEWMTDDPPGLLGRMALAAFVAFFAAFVALDMVQRALGDRRRVGLRWVVGVALGLGTGLWAAHVVALSALAPTLALGYHPLRILGAWGLAMAISMACLGWITHRDITVQRVVVAGTGLGVGMVATMLIAVWALGLQPAIQWKALELIVAFAAAMLACTLALGLFFQLRIQTPIKLLYRELAAAFTVAPARTRPSLAVSPSATKAAAPSSRYSNLIGVWMRNWKNRPSARVQASIAAANATISSSAFH